MANTTNLNLEKPIGTDQALVSVINSNMDKIDTFAGSTNQALLNVNNALSGSDIINNQTDKDLNHYITTKAWRIGNVSQLTNGPVWTLAGATGNLYVRANGSYISQMFIGNAGLASRTSADGGSTWNDWAGYALKSDVDRLFTNTSARYIKHFMFQNVASISIDLQHEQTNQYFSMIEVVNANQNVFSLLEGSVKRTYGGTAVSMALSGSTATIARDDAGTLWGITHVTLTTNYQLT